MEILKVNALKACITSKKGGITMKTLNNDYKELIGCNIPYQTLGFKSLYDCLQSIKGVSIKENVIYFNETKSYHKKCEVTKQKSMKKIGKHKREVSHSPFNKKFQASYVKEETPPKIYHYDPQNHAFQKNTFLFNQEYDEYECIFREQNAIYNLLYSLCKILIHYDITISSCLSLNIRGDYIWLQALKNKAPVTHKIKSCFQTESRNIILYGHQLIGDDFMIKLTSESFGFIPGGTCLYGLTLKEAQKQFHSSDCARNVLIACGSLDIHNGVLLEELIKDMQDLLLCVLLSGCSPVVCNIPPSPYSWLNHQISAFNYWLSSLTCIVVIDLYTPFIKTCSHIN